MPVLTNNQKDNDITLWQWIKLTLIKVNRYFKLLQLYGNGHE